MFLRYPFLFIFQRFECQGIIKLVIIKLLISNNNINKIQFFYCPFKSVITYITLTATDILNNITKQYYGIATVNKTIILRYYGKETVYLN